MALSISRRQLLRRLGFAAAASLPVFRPGRLIAVDEPEIPKRFVPFVTFNGTRPESFWPDGAEPLPASFAESPLPATLPPRLAPLGPFASKLLVAKGMRIEASEQPGGSHTRGQLTLLSGYRQVYEDGVANHMSGGGPTIDQTIAGQIGASTRFPSLQLGVIPWYGKIIWRGVKDPMYSNPDPWDVFDSLFGESIAGTEERAALERIRRRRASVLDHVAGDLSAIAPQLATAERARMEAHLESIRSLERELDGSGAVRMCETPVLEGGRVDVEAHENAPLIGRLQMDLIAAAFSCDLTRVASLQWSKGTSPLTFPHMGIEETHHNLSHASGGDSAAQDALFRIEEWYAQQLAYLLGKLEAIPEADGTTVLDHSVVFWGSEVGKGNSHTLDNIPCVLAGSAGGYFRTGRFVRYPLQPHNGLLISICNAMGLDIAAHGDADLCSGPLPGLTA